MSDRTFATAQELTEWTQRLQRDARRLCNTDLIKKTLELARLSSMLKTIGEEELEQVLVAEMYRRFVPCKGA